MEEIFRLLENSSKEDTVCGKFLKERDKFENLVFFGAGLCCKHMLELFINGNIKLPLAICDNNSSKWGLTLENIPIMSLDSIKQKYNNVTILVTTSMFISPVINQLKEQLPTAEILSFTPYEYQQFDEFKNIALLNSSRFTKIYNKFNDNYSKETWLHVLTGRATGDFRNFEKVFSSPQYFPKDLVSLSKSEIFLDIGGYTGDTVEEFIKQCEGNYNKIITVEPNPKNHEKIKHVVDKYDNIQLIEKGISNKKDLLYFNTSEGEETSGCFTNNNSDMKIHVDTIDNLISDEVTFLKMDIEGFELKALQGAQKLIKKFKPKLAICLYHNPIDFVEIPEYLESLCLDYKFYVRHHMLSLNETVLYAL